VSFSGPLNEKGKQKGRVKSAPRGKSEEGLSLFSVKGRIRDSCLPESFLPEKATVTLSTGQPVRHRFITTVREAVIYTKLNTFADNLSLGHLTHRRSVN